MVRDLMLDMSERDLAMEDKFDGSAPIFDTVWGNIFDEDEAVEVLICNVIVPMAYWDAIEFVDGEMTIHFNAEYIGDTRNFRVRLLALSHGKYSLFSNVRGDYGIAANSYALRKNIAAPIAACMLPYIDIDGQYMARIVQNSQLEALDKAYIYSVKRTDVDVDYSDDQASQLLSLCAPGKSYRYPTTGVGATGYLNSVVAHTDLYDVLEEQFAADSKPLQEAYFDNETGKLDVLFSPEEAVVDTGLDAIEDLNSDFFTLFTDEYVRRNTVLSEVSDTDFMELLDDYPNALNLMLFVDSTTTVSRVSDTVVSGRFDAEGGVISDTEHFIVTATLEADTVVMFDDDKVDEIKGSPVFIVNDTDETRLYTSLVEQPTWLTESCHKCFILKHRGVVRYMIRQDQFREGRGLYAVPQTSANIKNMLGLVQDVNTGRLLGIVSDSTNISDMTLDEVTQHIYATQIIQ